MKGTIPLVILLIYMVGLYAIAWYATKLTKRGGGGAAGYLLANRGFPVGIIAVMLTGLAVGGASTVGISEMAYTKGISAGNYNAAWGFGAILVGLFAASRFRNMNMATIPELFERFYTRSGRFLGVVGQLIIMLTIISLQYVAGGAILTALLPEYFSFNAGMIITAVTFIGVCLIGGYWAAGLSNLINVIVIYVGLMLGCISVVTAAGGFDAMHVALPDSKWWSLHEGMGFVMLASWFTVMGTQALGNQSTAQICFAAKSDKTARWGFILGGLLILPVGFISAVMGIAAVVQYPGLERAAMALPTILMDQNPIVSGVTLAALWAADVSTAVGLLMGCATMIVQDVLKPVFKPKWDAKKEITNSRITVIAVGAVTFIMALQIRSILGAIMIGLSLTTAYTIILMATFYFPKMCRKSSAFWTLLIGIIVLLLWQFVPSVRVLPHVIYAEWIICLITFIVVAMVDKNYAQIPEGYARSLDHSKSTI